MAQRTNIFFYNVPNGFDLPSYRRNLIFVAEDIRELFDDVDFINKTLNNLTSIAITNPLPVNQIFVGSAANIATTVPMSGDATIVSSGQITITGLLGNAIPANAAGALTNDGAGNLTWTPAGVTFITGITDTATIDLDVTLGVLTANVLLTSTEIGFGDGSGNLTSSSDLTWNDATNTFTITGTIGLLVSNSANVFYVAQGNVGFWFTGAASTGLLAHQGFGIDFDAGRNLYTMGDVGITNNTHIEVDDVAQTTKVTSLVGAGVRMVTASAAGVLSTAAIPAGTVTGVTATLPIISSGGAAPDISTSMNTNRLIGRSTAGVGVMEEIIVGTGLTLAVGRLDATAGSNNSNQIGIIVPYGNTTAPAGWILCDGSAVSRTTYAALFAVIGTTFGVGDGVTTFNVPDLRQRFVLGKAVAGTGSTFAGTGGAIDHLHTVNPPNTTSTAPSATQLNLLGVGIDARVTTTHTHDVDIPVFNSGTENPPFLTLVYIIKADAGGELSDGDRGDITVSASGATWTIDNDVVTNAKLADMATATIKGRNTAGTGDPEDLTAIPSSITATTQAAGDNSTKIATTAYADARFTGELTFASTTFNPADNTTYYMGGLGTVSVQTAAGLRRLYFTHACTITAVILNPFVSVASSAENTAFYVRLNNTTDYTITTTAQLTAAGVMNVFSNLAMSVPIAAGDYIEIKMVTPLIYVTNPTGVFMTGTIGFK